MATRNTGDVPGTSRPSLAIVGKARGRLGLDEDMRALLDVYAELEPRPLHTLDAAAARSQPTLADAVDRMLRKQGRSRQSDEGIGGVTSRDSTVQGAAGLLPATIYTPDSTGPMAVVVYFHGGGWVTGDRRTYDGSARGLALTSGALVVSVDYRLAPEHRFPAAWADAFAAYRYVLENATQWGGNPRHVALAGESAGGNLAIATAIAARDAGLQSPAHVLAIHPVTRPHATAESASAKIPALPLDPATVEWFFDKTVRGEEDLADPRLNLVGAQLQGLPPVTLVSAHLDPLLGDSEKLEEALREAHVHVERRDFDGVTHEFFGCAAVVDRAREAQVYAGERLISSFAGVLSPRTN